MTVSSSRLCPPSIPAARNGLARQPSPKDFLTAVRVVVDQIGEEILGLGLTLLCG